MWVPQGLWVAHRTWAGYPAQATARSGEDPAQAPASPQPFPAGPACLPGVPCPSGPSSNPSLVLGHFLLLLSPILTSLFFTYLLILFLIFT